MSNEAITWALSQPVKHSTAKFVLVVMANHADKDWLAFPSTASLVEATAQDRKTVLANIKRLLTDGFLEDTKERKGATKQIIVYRLKSPKNGTVMREAIAIPESIEQSQIRNSSESGTVPEFPSNSTVFPYKESQNSLVTVPKTGHGNQSKPNEPSGKPNKREQAAPKVSGSLDLLLKAGVDEQTAGDWLKHRGKKKASDGATVIADRQEQAGIAGITLAKALQTEMSRGWQGFNAAWLQNGQARASPDPSSRMGKAGQETAQAAQRLIAKFEAENEQAD